MARKKKHAEHVNHERWLVSYADFITLLFATFTALYAMSKADMKKMAAASASINKAFQGGAAVNGAPSVFSEGGDNPDSPLVIQINPAVPELASASPPAAAAKTSTEDLDDEELFPGVPRSKEEPDEDSGGGGKGEGQQATPIPAPKSESEGKVGTEGEGDAAMAAQIKNMLFSAGLKDIVEVREEVRGTVISLGEAAFFAPGSIEVHPQSTYQLDKIVNLLRGKNYEIRIEGHTDNTPVTSGRFRNNWELSTLRASRIVDFMAREYHFPPESLSSAGYGEFRPVADNATDAGRQKNRRVDIVILNQRAIAQEPRATQSANK